MVELIIFKIFKTFAFYVKTFAFYVNTFAFYVNTFAFYMFNVIASFAL